MRYNIICLAFLSLIVAGCKQGKETTHFFPLFDKIYAYQKDSGSARIVEFSQSPYKLSKDFYRVGKYYYFIAPESHTLLRFNPRSKSFKTIFSDTFSKLYLTSRFLVQFSPIFYSNKGFELKVYPFTNGKVIAKLLISGVYINLLPSDFSIDKDKLYLAGSDSKGLSNFVYVFNPSSGKLKTLFATPRAHNFLKIVRLRHKLVVYASVAKPGQISKKYRILNPDNDAVQTFTLAKPVSFFGKGFSLNGRLYIPSISSDNHIELLHLSNNLLVHRYTLPTGVYIPLGDKNGVEYFVGYNYFSDQNTFSFVRFDSETPDTVTMKPIRQ